MATMKPAIDTGGLIACSACAKAKVKCDKQVSSFYEINKKVQISESISITLQDLL
jgi:hypothetical protein